jgi:hypothetical protein
VVQIFFDTEFIDDGKTVDLVSIGLVRADGAEYYAEPAECDRAKGCEWVQKNVISQLTGPVKPRSTIADEIRHFCGENPEFWAYYAAYDWLALCQLYGRMLDTPFGWPHFVNDIQSLRYWKGGIAKLPQVEAEHHALHDARWNKQFFDHILRS